MFYFYYLSNIGMGSLFSRRRTRVTEQDKAVLQLKKQRDELKRFSRRATESIGKDTATIRELAKRNQKEYVTNFKVLMVCRSILYFNVSSFKYC